MVTPTEETPSVPLERQQKQQQEEQQQQHQETLGKTLASSKTNGNGANGKPVRRKRPPSLSTAPDAAGADGAGIGSADPVALRSSLPPQPQTQSSLNTHHQQNAHNQQHLEQEIQQQQQQGDEDWTGHIQTAFHDNIGVPGRNALHKFFYPPARDKDDNNDNDDDLGGSSQSLSKSRRGRPEFVSDSGVDVSSMPATNNDPLGSNSKPAVTSPVDHNLSPQSFNSGNTGGGSGTSGNGSHRQQQRQVFDDHFQEQVQDDKKYVERFWTVYDDIIILSLFTQIGIVFRLGAATWFTFFDNVFSNDSALFVNLPLNCFSCFMMGVLCSGDRLMEIISTRFTPPHLQQELQQTMQEEANDGAADAASGVGSALDDGTGDEEDAVMMPLATDSDDDEVDGVRSRTNSGVFTGIRRRRRQRRQKMQRERKLKPSHFHSWQPPLHLHDDLRDVQLLALERRIRASKCLVLFPIRKEDVDVMEHYFHDGYKRKAGDHDYDPEMDRPGDNGGMSHDLSLEVESEHTRTSVATRAAVNDTPETKRNVNTPVANSESKTVNSQDSKPKAKTKNDLLEKEKKQGTPLVNSGQWQTPEASSNGVDNLVGSMPSLATRREEHPMTTVDLEELEAVNAPQQFQENGPVSIEEHDNVELHGGDTQYDLDQILHEVTANVTENVTRLRRVNLADGWDVGTTPEAMSDDLMLGLRDGFCGAVSSFSSWNSAMVNLLRGGQVGEALVGYVLGLQLPIVAYRFGQHIAVYIFIMRARRETRVDERRGYGIRVSQNEFSEGADEPDEEDPMSLASQESNGYLPKLSNARDIPSVRAVVTALFLLAVVTQGTSLSFFSDPEHQQLALSLLFSPLGVLARWRLSKYNNWRPSFPIGTFTANILACALSGGLGTLLAGSPGPRESIVLVSFIAGFGGTLSSLATFIVEVLAGVDPVLLRFDGIIYAVLSIFWATFTGFLFSASADWADLSS
jgi:fluoride ion exporter CrcB/FEX